MIVIICLQRIYTVLCIFTQVCIPGLHISLGIFNRLYSLLENASHELDLLQAEKDTGDSHAGTSFGRYSAALRELDELQALHQVTEQVCRNGDQLLLHLTLSLPDAETNPQLQNCREWVVVQRRKAETLVM